MKHVLRILSCALLVAGLAAPAPTYAGVATPITAAPGDYYSGLATGQGHKDYYASLYGAGSPAYTAAIESEYQQASRAREQARRDSDQHNVDFWTGYIDGLDRPAEEEF